MDESSSIVPVMDIYGRFLKDLDTWFRSVRVKYGDQMQCGRGCSLCCIGLFDVPLPDALRIAEGYKRLAPSVREHAYRRSLQLHTDLIQAAPELKDPFFLHRFQEHAIDRLTERFEEIRCPFLGNADDCLIYEYRPLACILEGIPMVDGCDGRFDDWCTLNFTAGIDRSIETDLVLDYYGIEATVQGTSEDIRHVIPILPPDDATVFLPSVVFTFDTFWEELLK